MPRNLSRTRTFKLVGPHAGKTILLGSKQSIFSFVDGAIEVDAKEVETVAPILEGFYSCVVEEDFESAQGEYERANKIKPENSAIASVREAALARSQGGGQAQK